MTDRERAVDKAIDRFERAIRRQELLSDEICERKVAAGLREEISSARAWLKALIVQPPAPRVFADDRE